jgi:hypothetical protein
MSFNNDIFNTRSSIQDTLKNRALKELQKTLMTQSQWIKVHAAEYLLWTGHSEEVRKEFLKENKLHKTEPKYRIGIWRVLAEAAISPVEKAQWINNIFDAFNEINSPDQLHATETLAKLKLSPLEKYPEATQNALNSENRNLNAYAHWAIAYSSDSLLQNERQYFLKLAVLDSNEIIRKISAFVLRKLGGFTNEQWIYLSEKAFSEPDELGLRNSLLNTAFVTFPGGATQSGSLKKIREEMIKGYKDFGVEKRIELSLSLAEKGGKGDLPLLQIFLGNGEISGKYDPGSEEGADVRAAAAFAILKIKQRCN